MNMNVLLGRRPSWKGLKESEPPKVSEQESYMVSTVFGLELAPELRDKNREIMGVKTVSPPPKKKVQ